MIRTRELLCLVFACALVACGESAVSGSSDSEPSGSETSVSDAPLATLVQVYKTPSCGCCGKWAEHLEASGFEVQTTDVADLGEVKQRYGVPTGSEACHTAVVDGYVVEGHVPASDIARLLRERPAVRGLVVPGMPLGSPGMESPTPEPYAVYAFDAAGELSEFSRHQ